MVNFSALEIAKAKYSSGIGKLAKIIGQSERITKYASMLNGIRRNLVKWSHAAGIVIFVYGTDCWIGYLNLLQVNQFYCLASNCNLNLKSWNENHLNRKLELGKINKCILIHLILAICSHQTIQFMRTKTNAHLTSLTISKKTNSQQHKDS